MAKFYGEVGYGEVVESPPGSGVWISVITEATYFGDVIRNTAKNLDGQYLNEDIGVGNAISIVADDYAIAHFSKIKYVRWAGTLWTVDSVEVKSPRLILNIGSVYNGPTP